MGKPSVVVAGGGGFIGGHLVGALLEAGHRVRSVDCKPQEAWQQRHASSACVYNAAKQAREDVSPHIPGSIHYRPAHRGRWRDAATTSGFSPPGAAARTNRRVVMFSGNHALAHPRDALLAATVRCGDEDEQATDPPGVGQRGRAVP